MTQILVVDLELSRIVNRFDIVNIRGLVWLGFLFNGITSFMGYLMPKPETLLV